MIHYCWLSGEPWDKKTEKCFNSWKKYLPDWEYRYWTMESLPEEVLDVPTVKQAIRNRKWAFAADYIRIWVLKMYGGLYMDLDVELLRSPEDLFDSELIVGYEKKQIGAHFMASAPHHPFIEAVEEKLKTKSKQEPLPAFITPIYQSVRAEFPNRFNNPFPETFFNPFYWDYTEKKGNLNITDETYCIHWYVGGWIPGYKKSAVYQRLWKFANHINIMPILRKIRGY